ncbi:hypothetical protein DXG01_004658 [Tephrocybe rancida]|nr:hypothetical protein DXG01_004658 [Tephrocybe rancida]
MIRYLEPAVAVATSSQAQREEYSQRKATEFNEKCGKIWESYRTCVEKAVKDKSLDKLLQQARDENPLTEPPPPPPSSDRSS